MLPTLYESQRCHERAEAFQMNKQQREGSDTQDSNTNNDALAISRVLSSGGASCSQRL